MILLNILITTLEKLPTREQCQNLSESALLYNICLWYNPLKGMTSEYIRNMSEDKFLDMNYFLNEDDLFASEASVEGFYIF